MTIKSKLIGAASRILYEIGHAVDSKVTGAELSLLKPWVGDKRISLELRRAGHVVRSATTKDGFTFTETEGSSPAIVLFDLDACRGVGAFLARILFGWKTGKLSAP